MKLKEIYKSESSYLPFLTSLLTIGLSYGLYKGILDNYLAEIVGMGEFDRGITEFFRELPGFLLAFILILLSSFSAEGIFRIGGMIMIGGIGLLVFLPPEKALIILAVTIYSTGEHLQLGMKNTLSLEYAEPGHGGAALGIQNSLSNLGNIFGYLVVIAVFFFFKSEMTFRLVFLSSMIILSFGMISSFRMKGKSAGDASKRSIYFRRKFSKYYMLEILVLLGNLWERK